ncbi:AraC family transcriptional regulator [Aquimarina sp. MMG016]|uniref:helix-turn-helix domain-containing protein n=1 Tax=Aquimarina sp. MMG016 TaxID=2822690 RepID=UPI001B39F1D8|nr:AraC family transcriptional regulator [Aquimarina sp. MMG016]MBQ4820558.1 helix-turn-helix transcriptional regulator [Aquimarina sp. MMG016]
MENVRGNDLKVSSALTAINKYLFGEIGINKDIQTLSISPLFGRGQVRYTKLQNGLQSFDFNLNLHENVEIPVCSMTENSLQFVYCLEGFCDHQFESFEQTTRIEQFQTAVIHSDNGLSSNLIIKKNRPLILNILCIDKQEYFDKFGPQSNQFSKTIRNLLTSIKTKSKHFHLGNYNLKIAEQLKLLLGVEYNNEISELLSQKGRYYLILAKHIEQFHAEIENKSNTSGLLKNELTAISEISEYIKKNPEIQHSIKTLCLQSGLSPAKLQEGFKFMFERTVSDYVRNVRLEKAERLIKTTDLTISEVVYSVGLTSRSYFCKIFKKRFHYSPKEYKMR